MEVDDCVCVDPFDEAVGYGVRDIGEIELGEDGQIVVVPVFAASVKDELVGA